MRNALVGVVLCSFSAFGAAPLHAAPIPTGIVLQYKGFQVEDALTGMIMSSNVLGKDNVWVSVYAGMYRMSVVSSDPDDSPLIDLFPEESEYFNAFCIQTAQALYTGNNPEEDGVNYSFLTLKDYLGESNIDSFSRISALFASHGSELGNSSDTDAAFQLAIWSIVNETFQINQNFDTAGITAATWLNDAVNNFAEPGSELDFYVLSSEKSQNLLVWKNTPVSLQQTAEVPLPATLWLMVVGLLSLGLVGRRTLAA